MHTASDPRWRRHHRRRRLRRREFWEEAILLAVKHDGHVLTVLGPVGVEAHKTIALLVEREIQLATLRQDDIYARFWCSLCIHHFKRISHLGKGNLPACWNGEYTGAAGPVMCLPCANQPGVHRL